MATPSIAANAYSSLARVLDTTGGGSKAADTSFAALARDALGTGLAPSRGSDGMGLDGPSFSSLVRDAIGGVMETGHKSDAQTLAMASGKANVMDVVTAVAETDVALSTLVSVRDRVIQSYEDIMRMPI